MSEDDLLHDTLVHGLPLSSRRKPSVIIEDVTDADNDAQQQHKKKQEHNKKEQQLEKQVCLFCSKARGVRCRRIRQVMHW